MIELIAGIVLIWILLFVALIEQRRGEVNGQKCPFFLSIYRQRGGGGLYFEWYLYVFVCIQQNIQECRRNAGLRAVCLHILGHISVYFGVFLHILGYISFLGYMICALLLTTFKVGRVSILKSLRSAEGIYMKTYIIANKLAGLFIGRFSGTIRLYIINPTPLIYITVTVPAPRSVLQLQNLPFF